jgi:hypothetical protein
MSTSKTSSYRLQYLDWFRGLGAIIMLQGHVFDSFLRNDLRGGGPFLLSQFVGGMPPAIFLFLTGVTLAFLMDSTERKGVPPMRRVVTAFGRSGYLFFLAFAFRLQLWLFGQQPPWRDLFRVDILNCMGFAIAVLSVMALFKTMERIRLCAVLGLAIAFASPVISQLDSPNIPWLLRNYLVPDYRFFSFFPWGAYLAFGMAAGSAIRVISADSIDRAMQWTALGGGVMIMACQYFSSGPFVLYAKSEYWLNSPAQVLTKLGVALLMLTFAYLWTRYAASHGWSWVRQFGTTSLLVYWVHIELVYGRWLWFFKTGLNEAQTIAAAVALILLMLLLSLGRTNFDRIKTAVAEMRWNFSPKPGGAEGD